jgi:hypothetical protein
MPNKTIFIDSLVIFLGYNHTLCEMKTYVETSRQLVLYVARFENLKSKVKSAVKKLNVSKQLLQSMTL